MILVVRITMTIVGVKMEGGGNGNDPHILTMTVNAEERMVVMMDTMGIYINEHADDPRRANALGIVF